MVKICAISDTHGLHNQFVGDMEIPECDILIHAGDATGHGTQHEINAFMLWLSGLEQAANIIYVPGNHDFDTQKNLRHYEELFAFNGINLLADRGMVCEGLNIYGTPWTPFFYDWAWNGLEEREEQGMGYPGGPGVGCDPDKDHPLLRDVYARIPESTDVLVCHGPPDVGNLGTTLENIRVGSRELHKRVKELPNLKFGVFGHIHEGYGSSVVDGKTLLNVSSSNRRYQLVNKPVVFEL